MSPDSWDKVHWDSIISEELLWRNPLWPRSFSKIMFDHLSTKMRPSWEQSFGTRGTYDTDRLSILKETDSQAWPKSSGSNMLSRIRSLPNFKRLVIHLSWLSELSSQFWIPAAFGSPRRAKVLQEPSKCPYEDIAGGETGYWNWWRWLHLRCLYNRRPLSNWDTFWYRPTTVPHCDSESLPDPSHCQILSEYLHP